MYTNLHIMCHGVLMLSKSYSNIVIIVARTHHRRKGRRYDNSTAEGCAKPALARRSRRRGFHSRVGWAVYVYIYMYNMYAVGRVDVNSIGNASPASLARHSPTPQTRTEYNNNNKYAYYIYIQCSAIERRILAI